MFRSTAELFHHFRPDRQYEVMTMEPRKIIGDDFPSMISLDVVYGKGTARAWLVTMLQNLNDSLANARKFSVEQMRDIVMMLTSHPRLRNMNIAEYYIFFTKLKNGELGEIYGGIDTFTIGTMIHKRFIPWLNDMIEKVYQEDRALENVSTEKPCTRAEYEQMKRDGLI